LIIDSHVHVDEVSALGWIDPPETMIRLMNEAGIEKAAIMTYTDAPAHNEQAIEYIANAVASYPDRFIGYARVHPWYGDRAIALLEQAVKEYGFKGLKLHPVSNLSHPGDEATLRLVRKATELGVPTLYHCGDEPLTTPYELEYTARLCPEAKVIFGHMGGYFHAQEAIEVAKRNDNVYLETSAMPRPELIREAIDAIGAERVIFASDGPGCDPKLEVYKVERAGISEVERQMLFADNILKVWGGRA
jgi:predicted TIM-barrel fold metal-dependent hydrolase